MKGTVLYSVHHTRRVVVLVHIVFLHIEQLNEGID